METWSLLENTKWQILKEVAERPTAMSKIAKKAGTTVANVSQHLKILEAYGFVKAEKPDKKGKPGKPTKLYSLEKEFLFFGFLRKGNAAKKEIGVSDPYHRMIFSILLLEKQEDHYYMHKLLWQNEELIEKCKAISFLRSGSDQIELFILTDHLDEIRKNFSNITLKDMKGNEKKIVCWTHNEHEIEEGLNNNDEHHVNLVKNSQSIYDPDNIMLRWKI